MAKKAAASASTTESVSTPAESKASEQLRAPAEIRYADQLEALRQNDADDKPRAWKLSPRAVLQYIIGGNSLKAELGGKKTDVPITRKFFGDEGIVERAIVTLASERALLLLGEPGTGKSWLSEHLSAAICGTSQLTIQGQPARLKNTSSTRGISQGSLPKGQRLTISSHHPRWSPCDLERCCDSKKSHAAFRMFRIRWFPFCPTRRLPFRNFRMPAWSGLSRAST